MYFYFYTLSYLYLLYCTILLFNLCIIVPVYDK